MLQLLNGYYEISYEHLRQRRYYKHLLRHLGLLYTVRDSAFVQEDGKPLGAIGPCDERVANYWSEVEPLIRGTQTHMACMLLDVTAKLRTSSPASLRGASTGA